VVENHEKVYGFICVLYKLMCYKPKNKSNKGKNLDLG